MDLKVCLLGESGVGKTSLCNRFVQNTFDLLEPHTIGAAFQTKNVPWENKIYKLLIWDTAGQDRFRTIAPLYYRGAKAIIIVYDVSDEKTLEQMKYWIREVRCHAPREILMMIVGNKCDKERRVSKSDVSDIVMDTNGVHMETSAMTGENVDQLFTTIVQRIAGMKKRQEVSSHVTLNNRNSPPPEPAGRRCC